MAYIATLGEQTHRIEVQPLEDADLYRIVIDGVERIIDSRQLSTHMYSLLVDGRSFTTDVTNIDDQYTVGCAGKSVRLKLLDERRASRPGEGEGAGRAGDKEIRALMPGKVVSVLVAVGDEVNKDQGLLIIEAMKMENEVRSTGAGKVTAIHVSPGQTVEAGAKMIELE